MMRVLNIYTHNGDGYLDWWYKFSEPYILDPRGSLAFATLNNNLKNEYQAHMTWGQGIAFESADDMMLFMLEWT